MTEAAQTPPDERPPDHLTHLHKRKTQPPMPRDKRGWQVAPAPDGRGTPPSTQRPMHRSRGFIYFIVALLAINWLSVLLFQPSSQPRVTIPFTPYFISEVKAGKVKLITTKGDAVQGTFKTKVVYPPGSKTATPTTLFATQVPAFWNGSQLEALLTSKHVEINAQSTTTTTSLLA